MSWGRPFSGLSTAELAVHGWTYNGNGVYPVHRLQSGKYVRRYAKGWTASESAIQSSYVLPTREAAERARRVYLLSIKR